MAERPCPMCGQSNDTRARFCSACGVDLDAEVLLDPVAETADPEPAADGRSLAMLFVPLGVVVAIGLTVLVIVSGGDDDAPEPEAVDGVVEAPTATPLPTPTATPFRVTLPESTPPQPTPTRTPSPPQALAIEPADLSLLPTADATHLAIAHDRDLAYLDLATGEWTLHERVSISSVPGVDSLIPYADGVVTSSGETAFYIPIDAPPVALGQGQALGVVDNLVYVRDWSQPSGPIVVAFDEQGEEVGTLDLPTLAWAVDVLPSGQFLIEVAGQVFTGTGDASEPLATGNLAGVSGDRVLVFSCDGSLDGCRHSIFDAVDRTRVDVAIETTRNQSMRLAPDGRVLVSSFEGEEVTAYTVDETGSPVSEERLPSQEAILVELGLIGPALATDTTGLYARIDGDRLLFHGPTGDAITEVDLDFLPGFGDSYSLAFVTADG